MKKSRIISVLGLVFAVCAASLTAAEGKKVFEIRKASGSVKIDGDLKEYLKPAPQDNQIGILDADTCNVENGSFDSKADWSCKFYGLYDNKNIYLAFDVTDDKLLGSESEQYDIWKNDDIEIWFDANNDAAGDQTGVTETDQHQIVVTPMCDDEPGKSGHHIFRSISSNALQAGIKQAAKVKKDGWTLEVLIPIEALNGDFKKLTAGQMLGFNISAFDKDDNEDRKGNERDYLVWNGTEHFNPQQFGILLVK